MDINIEWFCQLNKAYLLVFFFLEIFVVYVPYVIGKLIFIALFKSFIGFNIFCEGRNKIIHPFLDKQTINFVRITTHVKFLSISIKVYLTVW